MEEIKKKKNKQFPICICFRASVASVAMEMRFDTREGRESDLSKGRWQAHDAPTACQIFQQSRSSLGSRPC